MSKTSIIENYYLTAPGFRESRWAEKIVPHAPWNYPIQVATSTQSFPTGKDDVTNLRDTLTEVLKTKYDGKKVDDAVAKGWAKASPFQPGWNQPSSGYSQKSDTYNAFTYAEKLLVNPGWEGAIMNETPPIPVTFQDKHLAGNYTQADTEIFERIKTRELNDGLVKDHGLEGLFGGLHRRRKSKKSKRGGKKRKTTRKH
jgi:hypothetical protein